MSHYQATVIFQVQCVWYIACKIFQKVITKKQCLDSLGVKAVIARTET